MNFSTQKASEVERLLSTDAQNGLTSKIAVSRLKEEGKNFLDPSLDASLWSSIKKLFFDMAHLPILCAIIMSFSYCSFLFGVLALLTWGIFMMLYTFFYCRAKRRIARAAMMSIAPIKVLRDGKTVSLPPHLLVRGDVLLLYEGDTVPCDAYILESDSLRVYEANAFEGGGQALKNCHPTEAPEKSYSEMHNMLFATSEILSGSCKAICTATGHYTLAVREKRVTPIYGGTSPDYFRKIRKRTTPLLYGLCAFCVAVLVLGFVYGKSQIFYNFFAVSACLSSLLFACTDGIAVIGYGLCLDILRRKKRARALLKNPLLLDLLPQLDCVLIDTDIMFSPEALAVKSIHTAKQSYRADDLDAMRADGMKQALSYAAALESCTIAENYAEENVSSSVAPERSAVRRFFSQNKSLVTDDFKTISFRPSGSGFYFDSVLLADEEGGLVVSTGDASSILRSCANVWKYGKIEPLTEQLRGHLSDEISLVRQQGHQIVAYAIARSAETQMTHSSLLHRNMTFLFFAVFQRRESGSLERFFNNCAKRKIEPIIFHQGSLESAGRLIGEHPLLQKARICDGRSIPDNFENYTELLDNYEIFASFSSAQKYRVFRELIDKKFKVGILARDQDETILLKDAHAVFLQEKSSERFLKMSGEIQSGKHSQKLLRESDVLIDHDVNAISDAIEAAFDQRRNLLATLSYLTGMLSLRIFLCLAGAVFGITLVSLLGLLMLNFLWDALVVYHLLTGALIKDVPPKTFIPDFRHAVKRSVNFLLPFALTALCVAIAFPILDFYIPKFGGGAMALAVFWSLLAISVIDARFAFGIRLLPFAKTRVLPILVLISLISALPFVCTLFNVSFHWLSPLITILLTLLFLLFKAVSNIRENKYKQ